MRFMTVSMAMRILVIISPATLTAPVRHPLGEEKEMCRFFYHPDQQRKTP
jgi:hypothetical protein